MMQERTITVIVEVEDEAALSISRDLGEWLREHNDVQAVPRVYNQATKLHHHRRMD